MFLLSHTPNISTNQHLVKQYAQLAMVDADMWDNNIQKLKIYIKAKKFDKATLGINAGATYGSAKRWYPERFAEVASKFSDINLTIATRADITLHDSYTKDDILSTITKRPLSDTDIDNLFDDDSKEAFKALLKEGKIVTKNIAGIKFYKRPGRKNFKY